MKAKRSIFGILSCALLISATTSFAKDHNWIIRSRSVYVKTDISSNVSILGGGIAASTDQIPELDITKFFNSNVAAELILGTSKHDIALKGSSLGGSQSLGSVNILPPTLTLQYHLNPYGKIRPYAGAGLNYSFFYNAKTSDVATSIRYQNHLGYALQLGFDYMIDTRYSVNFDVKKIFLKTHAVVNDAVSANAKLDPWLIGAGLGYRF